MSCFASRYYRGAGGTVLAVPAVLVEEDQVHPTLAIQRLLHPEKLLNRRARSTKMLRIERSHVENWRCTRCCICGSLRLAAADLSNTPPFLDFGHAQS
jgi:hypothetical protein